jgi:hypothetical protein
MGEEGRRVLSRQELQDMDTAIDRACNKDAVAPAAAPSAGRARFAEIGAGGWLRPRMRGINLIAEEPALTRHRPKTGSLEAQIYAKDMLKQTQGAKLAVLYQNDDFGKDYVAGLHDALSGDWAQICPQDGYLRSDRPDGRVVDSHQSLSWRLLRSCAEQSSVSGR